MFSGGEDAQRPGEVWLGKGCGVWRGACQTCRPANTQPLLAAKTELLYLMTIASDMTCDRAAFLPMQCTALRVALEVRDSTVGKNLKINLSAFFFSQKLEA